MVHARSDTENGVHEELRSEFEEHDFRKAMIQLPPITEVNSVEQANEIHLRTKQTLNEVIGLGKFLTEKKAELEYGQWGPWCADDLFFNTLFTNMT